jgi:iron-sulfur cluster repair protein YtfE (RIC family)
MEGGHILEECLSKSKLEIQSNFDFFFELLEKHMFIEEKAIFTQEKQDDIIELSNIIARLFKEHDEIQNLLKNMKKAIKKGREFDFKGFKETLLNHKNYEDETVYPKLDKELDETSKEEIIGRINEIT